ncbi:leukocyte receptor cluster-like protein [Perilla frutescens var. hirtella]|nr:leukocyte receptor cluster-like protein [Perilla frutescens var. hirtella]KAH6811469.1 leukocyte receptor cluster-like protein [Perilla frutescens var. frutescens]
MGGHGGLNILPQKRWNVYNFDNREKVRLDEEAAAKEEQLKREQSRKRDTELRLEQLRQARGLASRGSSQAEAEVKDKPSSSSVVPEPVAESLNSDSDSQHINLFEGIRIFDPIKPGDEKRIEKKSRFAKDDNRNKKVKREEVRVVGPEDEKYKLGYGVAGKGVKLPWYMEKRVADEEDDDEEEYDDVKRKEKRKIGGGKKTLEELREERLKREKSEKERERALLMMKSKKDGGFSSRRS